MIDIIIPVHNLLDVTKACIDSLRGEAIHNLIIVDNGSALPTQTYLRGIECILIRNEENLGYVSAINQGLAVATAEAVLLANNDVVFPKGMLDRLLRHLEEFDIVGPMTNYIKPGKPDNPLLIEYPAALYSVEQFQKKLEQMHANEALQVQYVYGHAMLVRKSVVSAIGLLDERFGLGTYDDEDYCLRARQQGFRVAVAKDCFIYHACHSTFKYLGLDVDDLMSENKILFEKKWDQFS